MVRTRGSAVSLDARGTISDAVSFGSWKGKTYLRTKALPKQPDTPAQLTFRHVLTYLTQRWPTLGNFYQRDWVDRAAEQNIAPVNFFTQFNLQQWHQFLAPSQRYPPTRTGAAATWAIGYPKFAALTNATQIDTLLDVLNATWACCIHRSKSSIFDITRDNLITVIPLRPNVLRKTYDRNLAAGTYYYRLRTFTAQGGWGPLLPQFTVVIA